MGASLSQEGDAPSPFVGSAFDFVRWGGGWAILLLPLAIVLAVVLAEWASSSEGQDELLGRSAPVPAELGQGLAFGPATHGLALAANADAIALANERVANGPGQWLRQEGLAAALLQRFALTHDYADLKNASDTLRKARGLAPSGSGPWLREAAAAMMNHDLAKAERALNGAAAMAVSPSRPDRAEIAAIRGDIAFYRGEMTGAAHRYREARNLDETSTQPYRRAVLARSQGHFDEARQLFAAAAATGDTPQMRAQIAMQIGRTDSAQGRYASAAEWYREADRLFPGSPLGAALNAEALALSGDSDGAIAALEKAIAAHRWPEMMDALAMIHRSRGERAESEYWSAQAREIWADRMSMAPLAAQAHAAEHELAFGDPRRALRLTSANLSARPHGEARILMANALLANGQPDKALGQLRAAEREGWRSAPMFAAMAEAAAMTGDDALSTEATEKAERINPEIFKSATRLAWFGHG
ncbi:tetratricopeptide repeat protein [Croceicoccus sediminis]|uniref:tetratricopeptide repeat protein n=1 Tax=Croceicoccus sediminis TaxID=2571150 RepID=UPI001182EB60|nr:tetratricopeptide repeat protein [Croceicoccus sediminis]